MSSGPEMLSLRQSGQMTPERSGSEHEHPQMHCLGVSRRREVKTTQPRGPAESERWTVAGHGTRRCLDLTLVKSLEGHGQASGLS